MRAAIVIEPGKLVVNEVPRPGCGEFDMVLRLHRASICATDLMHYEASLPCPPYPFILGHECSGDVVEKGDKVRTFEIGDRVTFWGAGDFGGFAEYRTIRSGPRELFKSGDGFYYDRSQAVIKLDDSVSYEEGAILEVLCSAMRTVSTSGLKPADKVVVIGLGAGGLMLLQLAKSFGARAAIGIDLEDFRLRMAGELGADAVYNNSRSDGEHIKEDILGRFGEVDMVFDALGNELSEVPARNLGLELLRPYGRYTVYGTPSTDQRIDVSLITSKGIQTTGATFDARYFSMDKTQDLLELSQQLVVDRSVKVKPLITRHMPLERTEDALKLFKERKNEVIRIVIDIVP